MLALLVARWIASRSLSSGAHSRDPLARNDVKARTSRRSFAYSRGAKRARGLPRTSAPKNRGRGECRVPDAPAAARVVVVSTRVSHHESTGITRHSRTRMVLTVSFALSPVTGLSCHCRLRSCLHRLDTSVGASGPRDFSVRVGAIRQRRRRVHRIPYQRP